MNKSYRYYRLAFALLWLMIPALSTHALTTIDENGNYFINDFESNVPEKSSDEEITIYVEGQGEWRFLKAFISTNTSYVKSGKQNLRLYKNGSYVITPVLDKGVGTITMNVGRKGKGIDVYVSTDAGRTWEKKETVSSTGIATITVDMLEANRVKIANDGSGDADIDDLAVTATAFGIEAQVSTGEASNITKNTADLSGTLIDGGDQPLREMGIVWSTRPNPTTGDRKALSENLTETSFTVTATRLKASTDYHYRAYAITNAGTVYGEDRTFRTAEGSPDDVVTSDGEIWCAPDGDDITADGTEQNPFFSLDKAIALVEPGMRICMKAGTYTYDHRINIDNKNGTEEQPIELFAMGGRAVLDFSNMPYHKHSDNPYQGVRLTSSYWHFYRIDICNASDNGLLIERSNSNGGTSGIAQMTDQAHDNIIEECNFYRNGDTGLQIKNLGAFNKVINCDSYLNCDEGQGDADGFAPKLSVGDGNYFYGCRAFLNSDDGWDVFYKKDGASGDNMTIILENCISYKNGFLDENTIAPDGNGNGFKCGSDQGAMNVVMNRCLAVCNKAKGFDQNHNAGDIIMNNCTGMTLRSISDKTYSYRIYEDIAEGHEVRLTNCIAINDNDATDKRDKNTGLPKPTEHGKYGEYGRFEVDETLDRLTVDHCEFQKADPTQFVDITNHADLMAPRGEDGQLPETTFAHLREGSFLVDAGVNVESTSYRGIDVAGISYEGSAPDLGAYELANPSAIGHISASQDDGRLHLLTTKGGMLLVTVDVPHSDNKGLAAQEWRLSAYDSTGKLLTSKTFTGCTTAVHLSRPTGTFLVRVEGKGFRASSKVVTR